MPNTLAIPAFEGFEPALVAHAERADALERFFTTPSGRQRPGPYWKIDIETLSPSPPSVAKASGSVVIHNSNARV
ncbi:MAG TPA: hypothetical protein VGN11_00820, partial [Candidatus Baltobacteraceae bacterium]|nr:hypothetical protein [Candidatus Baltobacteraceae bacterium]